MTGSLSARVIRIVIITMLFASMAVVPSLAAPRPEPPGIATSQQDEGDGSTVPGFGELPQDATLVSATSGALDEAVEAPVTLTVERVSIEAGESLAPVDGPQIIQVEQGLLTFEDDLGLEAEIWPGGAQFLGAGEVDVITNAGDGPAIIVRTFLGNGSAPDDGADADDGSNDDGADGEEGETRDRPDREDQDDETSGESARIHALYAQSTPVPDEVVITLTDDGFDPDEFELVQGGELVIENATETGCLFEIADLQIETELDAGDIESVTVDGSAGTHEFTCTDDDDEIVAEGSFFLARPQSTPAADETAEATETTEPSASPVADDASATPIASPELDETAEATPPATEPASVDAPLGVLIEATLETVPEDAQELFAAQILLDPDGSLSLGGADGSIGLVVSGGDLTVNRPGHSPARLRDGRSVLLPEGTIATLSNNGDDPVTLQVAGLTGAAAADDEPTAEPSDGNSEEPVDDGPIDMTGGNQFIPSDAEMEQMGLFALRGGAVENDDPSQNAIWFEDRDQAEELLPTFDWQGNLSSIYTSDSEETDYGEVDQFLINVDIFADESGATDFFGYVEDEIFLGQGDTSDIVAELEGVDQQVYVTFFDADAEVDLGFMLIQSGEYVITLYAIGPDLDATSLMEDAASLIFGPRG